TKVIDGTAYREYQAGSATVLIGAATILTSGDTLPSSEIDLASLQASQGFTLKNAFFNVTAAGDINGDGLDDLAGIFGGDSPYFGVKFGASGGELTDLPQGFKITNVTWNSSNGLPNPIPTAIGGAGDINGDGFNDIAIVGGTGAFVLNGHADPFP